MSVSSGDGSGVGTLVDGVGLVDGDPDGVGSLEQPVNVTAAAATVTTAARNIRDLVMEVTVP